MKAEVKEFWLVDNNFQAFWPDDPTYFGGFADLKIGMEGSPGADNFMLEVCTPRWFEDHVLTMKPAEPTHETVHRAAYGRHFLFVSELDEAGIRAAVDEIVGKCQGTDWKEIALQLARYFRWEFEDYQSAPKTRWAALWSTLLSLAKRRRPS